MLDGAQKIKNSISGRNSWKEGCELLLPILTRDHIQELKIAKVSRTFRRVETEKAFGSFACHQNLSSLVKRYRKRVQLSLLGNLNISL